MAQDSAPNNSPAPAGRHPETADAAGLTYVSDEGPGIRRRRSGSGFTYRGPDGKPVRDPATLARIRKLAIPPAYEEVWICPDPNGHIQATGRDARGRKQYRYHPDWRSARDETKYARMAAFGRALPAIRARVDADLGRPGLPKEKVLAAVVRLLELTLIRVGNDEYARANKHFGLTTLRNRHARLHGAGIEFCFKGKSGVEHRAGVHDRRLARVVRSCQHIPGQRLFQYYDEAGARRAIGSHDVNAYLHEATGEAFTAKDFRTWAATLAAAKALALQPPPADDHEARQAVARCVKATAGLLGNTPAVCRSAYIHPEVLTAFAEGRMPAVFAQAEGDAYEAAALEFLEALAEDAKKAA
ncbi:MAG TPA: DNA topoisomerase IB [Caulobacteraceae bacterium]|jgi:DNA topoisomerase-1|nr:DNA topoisomerase IB [Caulobacteraceae bacterium]